MRTTTREPLILEPEFYDRLEKLVNEVGGIGSVYSVDQFGRPLCLVGMYAALFLNRTVLPVPYDHLLMPVKAAWEHFSIVFRVRPLIAENDHTVREVLRRRGASVSDEILALLSGTRVSWKEYAEQFPVLRAPDDKATPFTKPVEPADAANG